jgi:hypothetical protein
MHPQLCQSSDCRNLAPDYIDILINNKRNIIKKISVIIDLIVFLKRH